MRAWAGGEERRSRQATPSATAVTISRGTRCRRHTGAAEEADLGSVRSGAASHPMAIPPAAARRATTTYSARSTEATRLRVAPTALRSPTRRIWSAIRLPTRTARLATASRPSSQPPVSSARRWFSTRLALCSLISCQEVPTGAGGWLRVRFDESRGCGRVGQLQVQGVRERASLRVEAPDIRPGEPDQAGGDAGPPMQDTSGYGSEAAVTATPTTWNDRLCR